MLDLILLPPPSTFLPMPLSFLHFPHCYKEGRKKRDIVFRLEKAPVLWADRGVKGEAGYKSGEIEKKKRNYTSGNEACVVLKTSHVYKRFRNHTKEAKRGERESRGGGPRASRQT